MITTADCNPGLLHRNQLKRLGSAAIFPDVKPRRAVTTLRCEKRFGNSFGGLSPTMTETIPDSAKSGNPDDRVLLHGMASVNSLASSLSPYVAKVEAFLRFIGLEYDVDSNFKGPKGKVIRNATMK